jgi:hypothetical protein
MNNRRWIIALVLIVVLIAGLRIFALSPDRVERYYSNGIYAMLSSAVSRALNGFSFSFFEGIIWLGALVLIVLIVRAIRYWRKGRLSLKHASGWFALRLGTFVVFIYLWFLCFWGLNYYRVPLAEKIGIQGVQADETQYSQAARWAASRIRSLYEPDAMGDPWEAAKASLAALDRVIYHT